MPIWRIRRMGITTCSLPAIAAGVIIAGCITTAVTCGVAGLM